MTREEASFILANIDRRVCDDELNEALDMAIKALEQEPCEDAISRQAALDLFTWTNTKEDVWRGIKGMPPVTPQPKTECSCEQIKWERDVAIDQLKELGYGFGEKPKTGHLIETGSGQILTNYQIYLILLGSLEKHDESEMLKHMLTELYKRAESEG